MGRKDKGSGKEMRRRVMECGGGVADKASM